jgi:hypothetical protein
VPARTSTTRPGGPFKSLLAKAACVTQKSRIAIHELANLNFAGSEKIDTVPADELTRLKLSSRRPYVEITPGLR